MKKIIFAILLLAIAGLSIFSYKKYSKCTKVDFATVLNREYIYLDNGEKTDITITFSDDGIYGSAGINRYFAGYRIDDGKIQFSPIGSTMMAGPTEKMELERKYLELLNNVDRIEAYKTKLLLITKNNETLKFVENTQSENQMQDDGSDMVGPSIALDSDAPQENTDGDDTSSETSDETPLPAMQ